MTTSGPDSAFGGGWIIDTNLRPFCESVAAFAGYDFDDSDWQAVETALPETDVERSAWYDYPLSGGVPLTLFVAADPGSSVVFVGIGGAPDDATKAKIEAALQIFAWWALA
ncbi:hypothetical protein [Streptomyces resistomycificus]|uniref:Uncharacterized protein n=1 Tax=Streptomyces resistomycificus TaxID=67356 RepID=A0A0L8LUM0_9ACTN|nr:hypothetical protein [Streptomyces resistomycificus]KOG41764.1 hypothetical protein ADK37_06625 [Streptomyces resistomycificus]KUN95809.1 hypothetical protein AQJ84_21770 [Streptomyces resistomycificus]